MKPPVWPDLRCAEWTKLPSSLNPAPSQSSTPKWCVYFKTCITEAPLKCRRECVFLKIAPCSSLRIVTSDSFLLISEALDPLDECVRACGFPWGNGLWWQSDTSGGQCSPRHSIRSSILFFFSCVVWPHGETASVMWTLGRPAHYQMVLCFVADPHDTSLSLVFTAGAQRRL